MLIIVIQIMSYFNIKYSKATIYNIFYKLTTSIQVKKITKIDVSTQLVSSSVMR